MIFAEKFMSLIAPPRCVICGQEGSPLCPDCTSVKFHSFGSRCYACNRLTNNSQTCSKCRRLGGPARVWINSVYDGAAERLIDEFKYHSSRHIGLFLARKMSENASDVDWAGVWLVPVPTASRRIRERSFDHTLLLAKALSKNTKAKVLPALARHGHSRQVGSNKAQRLRQAEAAYSLKNQAEVRGQSLILVDDVATTGATLQTCAKLLRRAGTVKIDALVFAKRL